MLVQVQVQVQVAYRVQTHGENENQSDARRWKCRSVGLSLLAPHRTTIVLSVAVARYPGNVADAGLWFLLAPYQDLDAVLF